MTIFQEYKTFVKNLKPTKLSKGGKFEAYAQQNFRICMVRMHSRVTEMLAYRATERLLNLLYF